MTLRQYAAKCDTTHQTVSAAIKEGRIVKGYNEVAKKIIPDVADLEWGLDFVERRLQKKLGADIPGEDENWDPFAKESDIRQDTGINELARLDLLYKARMGKLKVEEAAGRLVDKDAMYREMFEFGKEIRSNLQAIPDRIIDELMTLPRKEGHRLLLENINMTLERLSNEDSD
ncbi:MAG: hypothetical protein QM642_01900 [Edaphocola sp.]